MACESAFSLSQDSLLCCPCFYFDDQGVTVKDAPADKVYPMPIFATNQYDIEVGRIRKALVFENGLDFFVCGDQVDIDRPVAHPYE
jgi:aspartate-semialdehyde dehydrogenase